MTYKQILDDVYKMVTQSYEVRAKTIRDFIEREWQKADDQEIVNQYNRNRNPEDYIMDVSEMERHRGLVIGGDGTVEGLE